MNPAWQKPPRRTEQCFAVVAMVFFSGAMFRVFTGGDDFVTSPATALATHRSGNLGIQSIFMAIYVVTAALILPRLEWFLGL